MFEERLRSHHDAEARLGELLKPPKAGKPRGPGAGKTLRRIAGLLGLKPPAMFEKRLLQRLLEKPERPGSSAGVYIHVPFCDRICSFCSLNRQERKGADLAAYTAYLVSEVKTWGAYPYIREQRVDAVYFGGGTPSVLNAAQLQSVLGALKDSLPLARDCEITLESTLHNLGAEKAAALEAAGVNRLSMGIQTFSPRGRELLNRTYGAEKAIGELEALRKTFSGVLGIDIIYSYPGQTLEELRRDAEACVSLGVDSVSFYSLMIHQGSSLGKAIEQKRLEFQRDAAFDRDRHHLFYRSLRAAGFELLELSKLARPGRDAYRYIHAQYGGGDLIPIGSGAGGRAAGFQIYSLSPGRRFVAPPDPRHETYRRLLGQLQFGRYGSPLLCQDLGPRGKAAVEETARSFVSRGLLEADLTLSADGAFWGNNMAAAILEAAIKGERE
jgi:oxygen-independent coproporphyrinogen-3 oxidase